MSTQHRETISTVMMTGGWGGVILSTVALSRSLEKLHSGSELSAAVVSQAFRDVRRRGWTGALQQNEDL